MSMFIYGILINKGYSMTIKNSTYSACSINCEHEFQLCMLYALDGFLMGACTEQLENCENNCPAD